MGEVDYLLDIDGIKGESKDSKYPNAIHIDSWSFGTSRAPVTPQAGKSEGKVEATDLLFTKPADAASTGLLKAVAEGKPIAKAKLIARKAGTSQQEFLIIELADVYVSSYQVGGTGKGGDVPTDQFTLNYRKITMTYKEQQDTGGLGGVLQAIVDLGKAP